MQRREIDARESERYPRALAHYIALSLYRSLTRLLTRSLYQYHTRSLFRSLVLSLALLLSIPVIPQKKRLWIVCVDHTLALLALLNHLEMVIQYSY